MDCPICGKKITKLQVTAIDTFTIKENRMIQRDMTKLFYPNSVCSVQLLHDEMSNDHFGYEVNDEYDSIQKLKSELIVTIESLPVEILRELKTYYPTEKVMKKIQYSNELIKEARNLGHRGCDD